jgi:hypothetical protein
MSLVFNALEIGINEMQKESEERFILQLKDEGKIVNLYNSNTQIPIIIASDLNRAEIAQIVEGVRQESQQDLLNRKFASINNFQVWNNQWQNVLKTVKSLSTSAVNFDQERMKIVADKVVSELESEISVYLQQESERKKKELEIEIERQRVDREVELQREKARKAEEERVETIRRENEKVQRELEHQRKLQELEEEKKRLELEKLTNEIRLENERIDRERREKQRSEEDAVRKEKERYELQRHIRETLERESEEEQRLQKMMQEEMRKVEHERDRIESTLNKHMDQSISRKVKSPTKDVYVGDDSDFIISSSSSDEGDYLDEGLRQANDRDHAYVSSDRTQSRIDFRRPLDSPLTLSDNEESSTLMERRRLYKNKNVTTTRMERSYSDPHKLRISRDRMEEKQTNSDRYASNNSEIQKLATTYSELQERLASYYQDTTKQITPTKLVIENSNTSEEVVITTNERTSNRTTRENYEAFKYAVDEESFDLELSPSLTPEERRRKIEQFRMRRSPDGTKLSPIQYPTGPLKSPKSNSYLRKILPQDENVPTTVFENSESRSDRNSSPSKQTIVYLSPSTRGFSPTKIKFTESKSVSTDFQDDEEEEKKSDRDTSSSKSITKDQSVITDLNMSSSDLSPERMSGKLTTTTNNRFSQEEQNQKQTTTTVTTMRRSVNFELERELDDMIGNQTLSSARKELYRDIYEDEDAVPTHHLDLKTITPKKSSNLQSFNSNSKYHRFGSEEERTASKLFDNIKRRMLHNDEDTTEEEFQVFYNKGENTLTIYKSPDRKDMELSRAKTPPANYRTPSRTKSPAPSVRTSGHITPGKQLSQKYATPKRSITPNSLTITATPSRTPSSRTPINRRSIPTSALLSSSRVPTMVEVDLQKSQDHARNVFSPLNLSRVQMTPTKLLHIQKMLKTGHVFWKHSSSGSSKKKLQHVFLSHDAQFLCYIKPELKKLNPLLYVVKNKFPIASVQYIQRNGEAVKLRRQTEIKSTLTNTLFGVRKDEAKVDPACMFSIVMTTRTLDLEAKTPETAMLWAEAFEKYINQTNKPQSLRFHQQHHHH